MNENPINPVEVKQPHALTGLFAGDYFIQRINFGGHVVFAYGFVRRITIEGQYHCDYMSQEPPTKPTTLLRGDILLVGRISKRGYALARLRNWPNSESGVGAIVDFSAGRHVPLSLRERFRLPFFSTLILGVLISGLLLGTNLLTKPIVWVDSQGTKNVLRRYSYGWPIKCCDVYEYFGIVSRFKFEGGPKENEEEINNMIFPRVLPQPTSSKFDIAPFKMAIDIGIGVLILALIIVAGEYMARRRN